MKKNLFIPTVIIVLLVGCRPEENPDQLKAVNQSLENANGVMQEAKGSASTTREYIIADN